VRGGDSVIISEVEKGGVALRAPRRRMIEVTKEAAGELLTVLKDKGENPCVRIYVAGYG
jgi:hypothetical protein